MFLERFGVLFLFLSLSASAGLIDHPSTIQFTDKELQASYILVRPELSQIEFHGQKGTFDPAPAIKFFGIDRQEFDVDLSFIGDILDLRFNHLRAQAPQLKFENGALQIEVPLNDNSNAFRSGVGAIGCRRASIIGALKWKASSTGQYRLALTSVSFRGTLIGSGVFRSGFLLKKSKKLLLNVLENQLQKILNKSQIQNSIQNGLLQWGRVYTGETYSHIVPDSLEFFESNGVSGIRYQAAP